jgi:hypothetical protein
MNAAVTPCTSSSTAAVTSVRRFSRGFTDEPTGHLVMRRNKEPPMSNQHCQMSRPPPATVTIEASPLRSPRGVSAGRESDHPPRSRFSNSRWYALDVGRNGFGSAVGQVARNYGAAGYVLVTMAPTPRVSAPRGDHRHLLAGVQGLVQRF